jgi:5-methylcytosine-specific restriction endonuclease McrA
MGQILNLRQRDIERTKLRHETGQYEEAESFVMRDDSEWLVGADKAARCTDCARLLTFMEAHPHHKIERSDGHDDRLENLVTLCYGCHLGSSGYHA